MKVSLLNAPDFKSYSLSMLQALALKGVRIDLIGNADIGTAKVVGDKNVNYLNLRGDENPAASTIRKLNRILKYYFRLVIYAATTDSSLFHMQAHNKIWLLDRTILNIYYKILGKKLVFTAHNIDARQRDGGNTLLNRISLKILYHLMDHIFVHTEKMKAQLLHDFKINDAKITIIPHGILDTVPITNLTRSEARAKLKLGTQEKVLLFFGNIAPYKGLEYLLHALEHLRATDESYRLVIAGRIKKCQSYWEDIERIIEDRNLSNSIIKQIRFINDDEVEVFFKASDLLILPYRFIFQSGLPFLSYSFGLPVIVTDAGSLSEVVVEGKTGMICRKEDSVDLAEKIQKYYGSELFINLEENMKAITDYGNENYSWEGISSTICAVYASLIGDEEQIE